MVAKNGLVYFEGGHVNPTILKLEFDYKTFPFVDYKLSCLQTDEYLHNKFFKIQKDSATIRQIMVI